MLKHLPKRIPELDGLRAIAVLMVMAEHMYDGWKLPPLAMPRSIFFLLTHGWLGVDLFFILSGFLITGILLDDRDRPDYFKNFYRRRALRILPLVFVCLIIWFFAYGRRYEPYFVLALLFCANLDILFGVAEPHGPGVMWSLAVEEHFYWIWPIIVRQASRRGLAIMAATIVLLSPLLRGLAMYWGARPDSVYQLSWFRFDGLAVGALLAIFVRSPYFTVRNTWWIVGIWLCTVLVATAALSPFGVLQAKSILGEALRYTQAQALFAGTMAIVLAHQGSPWLKLLRSRFARFTALLSYCLYLVHLPLGDLYYWILHRWGVSDIGALGGWGALLVRASVIILTSYAIAMISQKVLEGPFMRLRRPINTTAAKRISATESS